MLFDELRNFFDRKSKVQNILLDFIDDDDDASSFASKKSDLLFDYLAQISEDSFLIKDFLILLSVLCNNHRRCSKNKLILKAENILLQLKDTIVKMLDGPQIYMIFHNNNRMVIFLLKNSFFDINQELILNNLYSSASKIGYFYPELRKINEIRFLKAVNDYNLNGFIEKSDTNFNEFLKNRDEGENENSIAKMVRNDLIDDFISYSGKTNFDAYNFLIERSVFETNYLLITKYFPKLINYASFFGSIQIFKYLITNKSQLPSDIWLYSIHGRNYEIIHLLEEYELSINYFQCFEIAVKCHHNEIAEYLLNNLQNIKNKIIDLLLICINQRNFQASLQIIYQFPDVFNNKLDDTNLFKIFFCFIQNGYVDIVKSITKSYDKCINAQNSIFIFEI